MKNSIINKNNVLTNSIFYIVGIIFILLIWLLLGQTEKSILFPSIIEVINDLGQLLSIGSTWIIILLTILKLVITIIIAYMISLILGILSYKYSKIRSFLAPLIGIMRSVPVASVIIIFLIFIGTKFTPTIITFFVIIPIASEAVYGSLKSIDKDIIDATKLEDNINIKVIFIVLLPISTNYLISTILSSLGLGLKVLIMGEVLAQGINTIGAQIQTARAYTMYARVFSWSIILIVIALIFEFMIKKFEKKFN